MTATIQVKREGDISDSFASLSGTAVAPLPQRFLDLKRKLIQNNEEAVIASWKRLLSKLKVENEIVAREGPNAVPSVNFESLDSDLAVLGSHIKERGVAVIRGVVPEDEARGYKSEIEDYVKLNPSTRGKYPEFYICRATTLTRKQHFLKTTPRCGSFTGLLRS